MGRGTLQTRLTRQAVRTALAARCGEVQLHVTPRIHAPWKSWGVPAKSQHGRDLGRRMYRLLAARFGAIPRRCSSARIVPFCGRRTAARDAAAPRRLRRRALASGGWGYATRRATRLSPRLMVEHRLARNAVARR